MKVQIKSLRVVNCGPLRDVNIDFTTNGEPRPITLLAGANGSGKTTVLELIFSLASRLQIHGPVGGPGFAAYRKAEFARLDLLVDGHDDLVIMVGELPAGSTVPNDMVRLFPINDGHGAQAFGKVAERVQRAIASQWMKPLNSSDVTFEIGSILFFPHMREVLSYTGTQVQRSEAVYGWPLRYETARQYESSLDSYLIWLEYSDVSAYSKVISFLNDLDFEGKKFGVSRKELKATVTTADGHMHGVSELSSGEQNLLVMLADLHRHLLPNSIVLIDEIENSLHPAFQHKIGNALKKLQEEMPFQLIASSHSREFLKIFGAENTLILTEF
jgi:predicted ATPase